MRSILAQEEAAREAANRASEREFVKLVKKLISLHSRLATIGEQDMGHISLRNARRFHIVTRKLHDLVHDLTQDAAWPHEPGLPEDDLEYRE
jgi:hypothetical protein